MKKVEVLLTNRKAHFDQPYPYDVLLPYFSFKPDGYRFMPAFRYRGWDGTIKILKYDQVPSGLFRALRKTIEEENDIKFEVTREGLAKFKFESGIISDRDYQNECADKMVAATTHGGGLILNATGTGKTFIAALYCSRFTGSVCFVVDQLDLLLQARKELEAGLKEKIGMIGDSVFEPQRVTVATIQTLHRHRKDPKFSKFIKDVQVLIIDEIHVAMNRSNFAIVDTFNPAATFGLTATLQLTKKQVRLRAFSLAGPVLFEYPISKATEEGFLTQGLVVQVMFNNAQNKGNAMQDYQDYIVDWDSRNDLIAEIAEECYERQKVVVVLVERLAHMQNVSELLADSPHKMLAGTVGGEKMEVAARRKVTRKLEKGDVRLIIANKVFKKGIDVKRLDAIVDGAALKSKNDCVQKYGRGVRLHPDKAGLLYFDIGDTGNRFEKASTSRRMAFKKAGIPVVKIVVDTGEKEWPRKLVDKAEKLLASLLLKGSLPKEAKSLLRL